MPKGIVSLPAIDSAVMLDQEQQTEVLSVLRSDNGLLIAEGLMPIKNDYYDDFYRGSVEFNPACRNYSFHIVNIPDGTTVTNCSFVQRDADNPAIIGENLTFISCNLTNVLINPSWTLEDCLVIQVDFTAREALEVSNGIIG